MQMLLPTLFSSGGTASFFLGDLSLLLFDNLCLLYFLCTTHCYFLASWFEAILPWDSDYFFSNGVSSFVNLQLVLEWSAPFFQAPCLSLVPIFAPPISILFLPCLFYFGCEWLSIFCCFCSSAKGD